MPLRKLWNSLCRRRDEGSGAVALPGPVKTVTTPEGGQRVDGQIQRPLVRSSETAEPPKPSTMVEPKRGILSMVSRSHTDGLTALVHAHLAKKIGQRRVLELGVGDASRSATLISGLIHEGTDPAELVYIVIDEFELNGGLPLRDYHLRTRGVTPRPAIVPDNLSRGLTRVLHRYGLVDVIIADPGLRESAWADSTASLAKVMAPGALLLRNVDGRWTSGSLTVGGGHASAKSQAA